jgi:hypothetical protein
MLGPCSGHKARITLQVACLEAGSVSAALPNGSILALKNKKVNKDGIPAWIRLRWGLRQY